MARQGRARPHLHGRTPPLTSIRILSLLPSTPLLTINFALLCLTSRPLLSYLSPFLSLFCPISLLSYLSSLGQAGEHPVRHVRHRFLQIQLHHYLVRLFAEKLSETCSEAVGRCAVRVQPGLLEGKNQLCLAPSLACQRTV